MPFPTRSAEDFLTQFQAMLPHGPVWPRDPDAVQTQALATLMPTYVRSSARATNLLVDAFPATTLELLPEWELSVGLPDPCTVPNASLQQRRAAVVAKLIGTGGQSIAYFQQIAAALGFTITIVEFTPFSAGMPCGRPDYGPAWAFAWQVLTFDVETFRFSAGQSFAGDPLVSYSGAELICRLTRASPAHTVIFFTFTPDPASITRWDTPGAKWDLPGAVWGP